MSAVILVEAMMTKVEQSAAYCLLNCWDSARICRVAEIAQTTCHGLSEVGIFGSEYELANNLATYLYIYIYICHFDIVVRTACTPQQTGSLLILGALR